MHDIPLDHLIRHKTIPLRSFLAASCTSNTSFAGVLTKIHSAGCNGLINLTGNPDASALISVDVKFTFRPGFRTNEKSLIIDWLLRYFNPSHKRRVEMLSGVTSIGFKSGPVVEPFWIDEINPSLYNPNATCKCIRENGTDVVATWTFVQFLRWLQRLAKWTNDIAILY